MPSAKGSTAERSWYLTEGRLTVELVPSSCWFSNVRSAVSSKDWEKLKTLTFRAAKYRCELCDGFGPKHPVECHEVFTYDDENLVQKLVRLIALCPACHRVKHIGLASARGDYDKCLAHLMKVNGWDKSTATEHVMKAFWVFEHRSQWEYSLDLSFLQQYDIKLRTDSQAGKAPACKAGHPGFNSPSVLQDPRPSPE